MGSGTDDVAQPPVRHRQQHLDVLRALALIAVLAGHVWYARDGWPNRLIYSWHVPLFFLLSGLLWRPGRSVRAELRHRWPVLVTPYIAWWLLNLAVGLVYIGSQGGGGLAAWVLYSIWGGSAALRPFTAFWFFSAFLVALLTVRLFERFPRWVAYAVAIIALTLCLIEPSQHMSPGWVMRRLPLDVGTGVAASIFLLVGQDLARATALRKAAWWGLGGLVVGFALVLLPVYEPLEMKHSVYGTPGLSVVAALLISCGAVLVSRPLVRSLPGVVVRAATWLSSLAVPVMLGQGIFLMLLDTPFAGRWQDFLIATAGSVLLAWLLRLSPVGDWFCGPLSRSAPGAGTAPGLRAGRPTSA